MSLKHIFHAPAPRPLADILDAKSALKTTSFYLGSMCSMAAICGNQQNLKFFLRLDRHCAQAEATRILSLVLAFLIVDRLLMGWLADRYFKLRPKPRNAT